MVRGVCRKADLKDGVLKLMGNVIAVGLIWSLHPAFVGSDQASRKTVIVCLRLYWFILKNNIWIYQEQESDSRKELI